MRGAGQGPLPALSLPGAGVGDSSLPDSSKETVHGRIAMTA